MKYWLTTFILIVAATLSYGQEEKRMAVVVTARRSATGSAKNTAKALSAKKGGRM